MLAQRAGLAPSGSGKRPATTAARVASPTAPNPLPAAVPPSPQSHNTLLFRAVEALFGFKPLFSLASRAARRKILLRGREIGLDFEGEVVRLRGVDWDVWRESMEDPALQYPAYYTQPFHAYDAGNLCWEAAIEATVASRSVHAPVMDPEGKRMAADGDEQLRRSYSAKMRELMEQGGVKRDPKDILDLGCSVGLSTRELARSFPAAASVTGLDLSPFFLAVAAQQESERRESSPAGSAGQQGAGAAEDGAERRLQFRHAAAEATGLPDASADLVACCLVMHELPAEASRAVVAEAFRLLRPGGALAVMEMDPASPGFQRVFRQPLAYAAFKATEPWLASYLGLDLPQACRDAGFARVLREPSSPRHFTLVAVKD